ncbi:hypothetical protein V8E55_005709 [Tylopilus felleus]
MGMLTWHQGIEQIIKFDERAPFGETIGPSDMFMQWGMDIKETKMVKIGQSKRKFYVYNILAKSHINLMKIYNNTAGRSDTPSQVEDKTRLAGVRLKGDFKVIVHMLIKHGGNHDIIGNGKDIMQVWKLLSAMSLLGVGKTPDNWRQTIDAAMFNEMANNIQYNYFCCHTLYTHLFEIMSNDHNILLVQQELLEDLSLFLPPPLLLSCEHPLGGTDDIVHLFIWSYMDITIRHLVACTGFKSQTLNYKNIK